MFNFCWWMGNKVFIWLTCLGSQIITKGTQDTNHKSRDPRTGVGVHAAVYPLCLCRHPKERIYKGYHVQLKVNYKKQKKKSNDSWRLAAFLLSIKVGRTEYLMPPLFQKDSGRCCMYLGDCSALSEDDTTDGLKPRIYTVGNGLILPHILDWGLSGLNRDRSM